MKMMDDAPIASALDAIAQSSKKPQEAAASKTSTPPIDTSPLSLETAMPLLPEVSDVFWADSLARIGRKAKKVKQKQKVAKDKVFVSKALFWYGRHSNPHLEGTRSPDRQEQTCLDIIRRLELEGKPVGFFDRGIKGKIWDRPDLQRLVDALKANPGCRLVVENVDRLLRDAYVLYMLGPILVDYDIKLYDANGLVEEQRLIDETGKAIYSYKKLCQISLQSLKLSMKSGRYIPPAPYGYDKPKRAVLAPNAKAANVIKMFEMRSEGELIADIARHFTDQGIPTLRGKARWSPQTIRNMLENMIYAGWTVYNLADEDKPVIIETAHTAIVSRELFAKVQAMNDLETKSAFNPLAKYGNAQRPFLLSNALICPDCGGHLRTVYNRKKRMMRCSNAVSSSELCGNQDRHSYELAESHMLGSLGSYIGNGGFDGPFVAELAKSQKDAAANTIRMRDDLTLQIDQLRGKISKAKEDAFNLGMMAMMKDEIEKHERKVEELTAHRAALPSHDLEPFLRDNLPVVAEAMEMIASRVPFIAENADEIKLRSYIQAVLRSVVVRRVSETRVAQTTTFDFGVGIEDGDDKFIRVTEVEYDVQPLRSAPEERREMAARLRDARTYELSRSEMHTLTGTPVVRHFFGACPVEDTEQVLQAFATAVASGIPFGVCCTAYGMRQWHRGRKAFDELRHGSDRTEEFIRAYLSIRPESRKLGAIVRTPRNARYLRSRFVEATHPLLSHPLCQLGAPDRDMTEAEWGAVLPGVNSIKEHSRFDVRAKTVRADLNGLFRLLRRDTTWRQIYSGVQAMNVSRRIWVLMVAGDIARVTRNLLVAEGLRSARDTRPVPELAR